MLARDLVSLVTASTALLLACGSSTPSTSGTTGSSVGATTGSATGSATGGATTGASTGGAASSTTGGTTGTATGGSSSGSGSISGASSSGTGGLPIAGLTPEQWTWVDFPDSQCRDGSRTGIAISQNPASSQVLIYLEGGGACFNAATCASNPSAFNGTNFAALPTSWPSGILDRTNSANPAKDWNLVFVPYCTGDVHAGNAPGQPVSGAGAQQFLGYPNMTHFLDRLVPTFSQATEVLLTGSSAGGFGALANYLQVARAFGGIPVELLDDSGPFMEDPYLASCLQDQWRTLWGLDGTIIADCGSDCSDAGASYLLNFQQHAARAYPNRAFGLLDSTADAVIRGFWAFGASNCTALQAPDPETFDAGLMDIRTQLSSDANFGLYAFASTEHTSLLGPAFYTRSAAGVLLTAWTAAIMDGGVTNIGP